jgi:DNA repair exonuclease SbcCD ATPase subunit
MKPYLTNLRMKNFLSYGGEQHIPSFPVGTTYVIGENTDEFNSNGSGKSSLLNAHPYLLYNQTSLGLTGDGVITIGEPEVQVECTYGDILVKRGKVRGKSTSLSFFSPTAGWVEKDLTSTQAALERELKLPKKIFFSGFWIDQNAGALQLLLAKGPERLKILQEVFSEDQYKALAADACKMRKSWGKLVDSTVSDLSTQQATLQSLQATRSSLLAQMQREQDRTLQAHQDLLERLRTKLQDVSVRIRVVNGEETEVLKSLAVDGRVDARTRELVTAQSELRRYDQLLLTPPVNVGDFCEHCGQVMTKPAQHKICEKRTEYSREQFRLQNVCRQLEGELRKARERETRLIGIHAEQDSLRQKHLAQRQELHTQELEVPGQDAVKALYQQVIEIDQRIQEVKNSVLASQMKHELAEKQRYGQNIWEEAFGLHGIPHLCLGKLRNFMGEYCSDYLMQLAGPRYHMKCTLTDTAFDVDVATPEGVTDIRGCSGGVRWRFNLALFLGFRRSLQALYPTTLGMVVLDDVYSVLDEDGEACVQALVTMLGRECPHVLVAVPREPANLSSSNVIKVSRWHDRSKIVGVN